MAILTERLVTWFAVSAIAIMAGCGKGRPEYKDVYGKVTLDGVPLSHKSVTYMPEPGTRGMGAGAVTLEDGSYRLLAVAAGATRDISGVRSGKYRIVVAEPMFPLPTQASSDTSGKPLAFATSNKTLVTQPVPAVYTKKETTPLSIEVGADGGEINLDLRSRP